MPYINIRKTPWRDTVLYWDYKYISSNKTIKSFLQHRCINCDTQCSDCYLDYMDKIALEKILKFLIRATKTIKIKGVKKLNARYK